MSTTENILLINQVSTSRRLAQVETEMLQQRNEAERKRLAEDLLQEKRDLLFSIRQKLEDLIPIQDTLPVYCIYIVEFLKIRIEANSIAIDAFPDLVDKEYALRVLRMLTEIEVRSRAFLGDSEVRDIERMVSLNLALPHARNLASLLEIRETLPATPWYQRIPKHRSILRIVPLLLILLIVFDSLLVPKVLHPYVRDGIFGFLGLGAIYIWLRGLRFNAGRRRLLPRLKALVESAETDLTENSTREMLSPAIESERYWLHEYGIQANSVDQATSLVLAREIDRELSDLKCKYKLL